MENEDLKGFFKVNFRFRCEWKFISVKEEITTTRPENNIINDFERWKILQNSPKISNETISETQIKFQTTTTEKAEEKIKLTTTEKRVKSSDEKWDIWQVENISETKIELPTTITEKADEKISETQIESQLTTTEKAEVPGEKNDESEKVSKLNIVQFTEEIKKNEIDKTTNYTNYVDLPKFKTEKTDKEDSIHFIVTTIIVAVLLVCIGTMIVLIILCKKKSEVKVTNLPLQSVGGDSK